MAATPEGAQLTEAHRLAQLRIGQQTSVRMLSARQLLDPADLDASFLDWLSVVTPIVETGNTASATLAANYLSVFRALELGIPAGRFTPAVVEGVDERQLRISMLVNGPISMKNALQRGVPLSTAAANAAANSAGAAMRLALNGGRDTVLATVAEDRRALGWARAASGGACAFCAMLASRGPVYSERTVDFEAHSHCACAAEPVYRDDAGWPAGSERYREIWDEATEGLSGTDATNAFRRALEGAPA